jgi:RimJ/RimL family protein N-acetyltransferase
VIPTLSDGIARLRPYAGPADDAAALLWYRDPIVLNGSEGSPVPFDPARIANMYAYLAGHGELYMIEVREGSSWRTVGDVTLAPDTLPIVIGDAAWRGRGIGTRALRLLVARAQTLGWPRLVARCVYVDNEASRQLFRRLGFKPVGHGHDQNGREYERLELLLGPPASHEPSAR